MQPGYHRGPRALTLFKSERDNNGRLLSEGKRDRRALGFSHATVSPRAMSRQRTSSPSSSSSCRLRGQQCGSPALHPGDRNRKKYPSLRSGCTIHLSRAHACTRCTRVYARAAACRCVVVAVVVVVYPRACIRGLREDALRHGSRRFRKATTMIATWKATGCTP